MAPARGLHGDPDLAGGEIVREGRSDLHIPHVDCRHGVQEYLPEEAGEAEEVLVLHPAGVGVLEYLGGQLVLPGDEELCQLKLRGGEAVLAVADVAPVAPHRQAALRPLEGDKYPLPRHTLRQGEIFDIAPHGVVPLRYLPRLHVLHPVPGVLHVHILGPPIALELDVGGHGDNVPPPAVHVRSEKSGDGPLDILRVVKEPVPAEGEPGGPLRKDVHMVGVGRLAVVLEKFRGFCQRVVEFLHTSSSTISFPKKSPFMVGSSSPPYIHPAPERISPLSLER